MRVRIVLHAALRRAMPQGALDASGSFECEAATPAEAMRALFSQHKPERPCAGERWRVAIAGVDNEIALHSPLSEGQVLHAMPAVMGAGGKGGFLQIIIGVVLIVVGVLLYMYGGGLVVAMGIDMAFMAAGVAMLAGGLIQMLSPQPKLSSPDASNNNDPERSRYLGAAGNTVEAGTRIPVGYGRHLVHGHYIHFDVEAELTGVGAEQQPPWTQFRSLSSALKFS